MAKKPKHDTLLKKSLLPDTIKILINLDTLKPEKESFIEANLSARFSDLLFSVRLKNDNSKYIYLLLENQSTLDPWMSFRLLKYMLCICDRHLVLYPEATKLPLVYPILFYNGQRNYSASRSFWELFTDADLAKAWWNNDHQLVNVNEIPDDELKQRPWSGIMEFFLKYMHERNLLPKWQEIAPLLSSLSKVEIGYEYIELMLTYTLTYINKSDQIKIENLLNDNLKKTKEKSL